jgi:hypothetical protein
MIGLQVARKYGQILKEMGFLSKGDVEYIGASTLIGDAVGVTQRKINEMFNVHMGKVLLIDEAAQLSKNHYGQEGLKVFLERLQGTGQDICVILTGYEEDLIDFFETSDQGLKRRFGVDTGYAENFVYFSDYDNEELIQIMMSMAKSKNCILTEPVARFAVENHLSKLRNKPGFGNGGAVDALLIKGQNAFIRSASGETIDGFDVLLESHFPVVEKEGITATALIQNLVNADHIVTYTSNLKKAISMAKRRAANARAEFDAGPFMEGYVFVGPPGTGT